MTSRVDFEFSYPAPQVDSGYAHYEIHRLISSVINEPEHRPLFAALWPPGQRKATVRLRAPAQYAPALAEVFTSDLLQIPQPALYVGATYPFVITVNPVTSITQPKGSRKKLKRSDTIEEAAEWLVAKLEAGGFELTEELDGSFLRELWITKPNAPGRVTLQRARFAGVLRVIDEGLAQHTYSSGIGRAKGFGLGMPILLT